LQLTITPRPSSTERKAGYLTGLGGTSQWGRREEREMPSIRKDHLSLKSATKLSGYKEDDLLALGEQGDLSLYVFINTSGKEFLIGKLPSQKVLIKGYKKLTQIEVACLRHSDTGNEVVFCGVSDFSGTDDLKIYFSNGSERYDSPLYVQLERDVAYSSPRRDGILVSVEQIIVRQDELLDFETDSDAQKDKENNEVKVMASKKGKDAQDVEKTEVKAKTTEELLEIAESIKADGGAKGLSDKEIVQKIDATECSLTDAHIGKMFGNYNKNQHDTARKHGRRLRGKST
jgi:hypothetical protein